MPRARWHDFGNGTFAFTGGSNIGFIEHAGRSLMVDAGLDRDSAKKALRAYGAGNSDDGDRHLAGVAITHGHADHFGGAGWVARQHNVPVLATPLEGAFVHQPTLEPLFLHGGAAPFEELCSKFTLAREATPEPPEPLEPGSALSVADISVDVIALPGHAPQQVGFGYPSESSHITRGRTLFCGDAVFPAATLDRHPILFCTDLDAWLETLERLPQLPYERFVGGHGEPVSDVAPRAQATASRLREIRDVALAAIARPTPPHEALAAVAAHFDVAFSAPQFFLLSLTTVNAALTSLQRAGQAEATVVDNQLMWRAAPS